MEDPAKYETRSDGMDAAVNALKGHGHEGVVIIALRGREVIVRSTLLSGDAEDCLRLALRHYEFSKRPLALNMQTEG